MTINFTVEIMTPTLFQFLTSLLNDTTIETKKRACPEMFTLHPSIYLRNYHKFFRATRNTGFGTLFTQKKIILNKPVA